MDLETRVAKLPSNLPSPDTYEQEYTFWPWGGLLEWVASWVERNAPKNAVIIDYMCGTGHLLNAVKATRPDLSVYGCSITAEYIAWAQKRYHNINIVLEDALVFQPPSQPDVVLCTAGLHHLPYEKQQIFLDKIASEIKPSGHFIIGEELIGVDVCGHERQRAVLDLWFALMRHAVDADAPRPILDAALGVLRADLFAEGEYKRSQAALESLLRERFRIVESVKMWPSFPSDYGDWVWVCAAEPASMGGRE